MDVILAILGFIALIFICGIFGGVLVWLLWPICIPAAFPKLVTNGYLAVELTLWQSLCLSWVFNILIKSTQTNNNKKE